MKNSLKVSKPYRILAQVAEGAAWHVYARFCNPMERDRVLARDLRRASVNWMKLKTEDLPAEKAPAGKKPKKTTPKKAAAGTTSADVISQHKQHWQ